MTDYYYGYRWNSSRSEDLGYGDEVNPSRPGSYMDEYEVMGASDSTVVRVYAGGREMDEFIQIVRDGVVIASNDDSGYGNDAYLSWVYKTGDVIRVTSYESGETGNYTIQVGSDIGEKVYLVDAPSIENNAPEFVLGTGHQGTITDTSGNDSFAPITGQVTATDNDDVADTVTYSVVDGEGDYGTLSLNSETGAWTFTANEDIVESLGNETVIQSFVVKASDGEHVTSTELHFTINGANDAPTGDVSVRGTPVVGQTLEADASSVSDIEGVAPDSIQYQWLRNGEVIVGATAAAYVLTADDVGANVSVRYSYLDGNNTLESVTSDAITARASTPAVYVEVLDGVSGENGDTAQISVTLGKAPLSPVTIVFEVSDGSEGKVSQEVTFTAENWDQPQIVTITGVDDFLNDGNVAYTVTGSVITDDLNYARVTVDPINLVNNDDGMDADMQLYGTNDVDYLVGFNGNDRLYGAGNMDDLKGGNGNDRLYGEQDDDILHGEAGDDQLYGGYDDDRLYGGEGNDRLYGEAGADRLEGGAGNDIIDGGLGADILIGGAGNDTYYVDDAGDVITDNGLSSDVDTVIVTNNITYTLDPNVDNGELQDGTGDGGLVGNDGNNTLTGNDGSNTIDGGAGNDVIDGSTGTDTVTFAAAAANVSVNLTRGLAKSSTTGTDRLSNIENVVTGTGNDVVAGTSSANTISTGFGNDRVSAGAGNDSVNGGIGRDFVFGGSGSDKIWGGNGNDILSGGWGNDVLAGGAGRDVFVFNKGDGRDVVMDFVNGQDKFKIAVGAEKFTDITVTDSGSNTIINFGDVAVTLRNVDHTLIDATDFLFV